VSGRHAGDSGADSSSGSPSPSRSPSGVSAAQAAPTIRVLSGNPTASELAAVTAVLASLEAERAAEAAAEKPPALVSAWEQSRRGLRTTITVGPGQWGRHAG
jgi:hypothetical protein